MNSLLTHHELDKALFKELYSASPDKERLKRLVASGANINALDDNQDSVLMVAIEQLGTAQDWSIIELLLALGADLHYQHEEGNCLWNVVYTENVDLMAWLLNAGANPNTIGTDGGGRLSLWDWVKNEYAFRDMDRFHNEKPMAAMLSLLASFGAKPTDELFTQEITGFLEIDANTPSGLFSRDGNLPIACLSNAPSALISAFEEWHRRNPTNQSKLKRNGFGIIQLPTNDMVTAYIAEGLQLAQWIKRLLGEGITVRYKYINHDQIGLIAGQVSYQVIV